MFNIFDWVQVSYSKFDRLNCISWIANLATKILEDTS